MSRVNLLKKIKVDGRWLLRSIPKRANGNWDWAALPDGKYFIEWYEGGRRRREFAGVTVAQVSEAQRRKRFELQGLTLGFAAEPEPADSNVERTLHKQVEHYLSHVETLKKPNTYRKYQAVLRRFESEFPKGSVESITVEELNDFIVRLMKRGMSANTVRHNVIIVAQFFRRNGRPGLTREMHLPERISTLPREYSEDDLGRFFGACDAWERALFSTFLLTGMREQEVMHLCWPDIHLRLRTIRVTAKPERGFYPKRWEEREIPIASHLVNLLEGHPRTNSPFVYPSPTGNREQNMLRRVKEVAVQAGLKTEFDLKTFRSTFATRMLRAGFDVRTVQHWMGHKSLETTMRYLVPATDVHERLNQVTIPAAPPAALKSSRRETADVPPAANSLPSETGSGMD